MNKHNSNKRKVDKMAKRKTVGQKNLHTHDDVEEIFDVYRESDQTLRPNLNQWLYSVCNFMVCNKKHKRTVAIVNVINPLYDTYIRKVIDRDIRKIAEVCGIRIVITLRAVPFYGSEDNLYIHLSKYNRIAPLETRQRVITEILNNSHNVHLD
jgi:hypothetical protein